MRLRLRLRVRLCLRLRLHIICTCFASGGRMASFYDDLRNESCQALLGAIEAYAAPEPVKLYNSMQGFIAVFKRAWNWLAGWLGLDGVMFKLNEGLIQLLIRIGFTKEEATAFVNEVGIPPQSDK